MIPVISVVAFSGPEKTSYMEKLISALKGYGLKLAVVKYDDCHQLVREIECRDDDCITRSQSDITALVAEDKALVVERRPRTINQVLSMITDVDLILTEGYKDEIWPKIMLYKASACEGYVLPPEKCLAVVSDDPVPEARLQFGFDDVDKVAQLVSRRVRCSEMQVNPLANVPFLRSASQDTMQGLWQAGRISEVAGGKVLIEAKKQPAYIYILLSGQVKVYGLIHSGNSRIFFILGPGSLLNNHVVNEETPALFCETIDRCRVFAIPFEAFLSYMKTDFELTKSVLEVQEVKMWRLAHQLKNTASSIQIERKLAAKLSKLARDFGKDTSQGIEIDFNISVTLLSEMMGIPRETASRACKRLKDYDLISINRKRITILDLPGLIQYYKEGNEYP